MRLASVTVHEYIKDGTTLEIYSRLGQAMVAQEPSADAVWIVIMKRRRALIDHGCIHHPLSDSSGELVNFARGSHGETDGNYPADVIVQWLVALAASSVQRMDVAGN